MSVLVLDVPTMFADHHVVEVRRILLGLPGVETVDASSAFRVVSVTIDESSITEDAIRGSLDEAGYLNELDVPLESGEPTVGRNGDSYFRHTAAYEETGGVMAFGQDVVSTGRPLWPCPGMGPAPAMDE
jgi:copper chaperone CopZ